MSGQLFAQLLDDRSHAFQNLPRSVVLVGDIIHADEDDRDFGLKAVEVAVVEAPENVLGVVAADAEVEGVAGSVILAPDLLPVAFPALGNGVANEDDLRLTMTFLDAIVEQPVALVGLAFARDRLDALMKLLDRFDLAECGGRQEGESKSQVRARGDNDVHA